MIELIASLLIARSPDGYDRTALEAPSTTETVSEVVDLKECIAADGVLPGDCFFPVWKRPWVTTGEPVGQWTDRELRDAVLSDVKALQTHFPAGPVLSFTGNVKAATRAHLVYYAAYRNQCPACWDIRPLDPGERTAVAKETRDAGVPGDFEFRVSYTDLWADWPTLSQSMELLVKQGYPRAAAFLSPAGLDYVWAPNRMVLGNRTVKDSLTVEPTPGWVARALHGNREFICRAEAIVRKSGLGWKGWMERHGYVPGDRTPLDMQYNRGLLWATRAYLIETWKGQYGRIMPWAIDWNDVYREERKRHFAEESAANKMVDEYLGSCRG